MPDAEEMVNALDVWLPDYIEGTRRIGHVGSHELLERAFDRVRVTYAQEIDDDADADERADSTLATHLTHQLLFAFAEWIERHGIAVPAAALQFSAIDDPLTYEPAAPAALEDSTTTRERQTP